MQNGLQNRIQRIFLRRIAPFKFVFKIRRPHRGHQAVRFLLVGYPWSPSLWESVVLKSSPQPRIPWTSFHDLLGSRTPCLSLRDAFLAQKTIFSAQKAPAGRISSPKYNFICPKGPCGILFQLKMQFYLPKSPLRDDLPAQNTI